MAWMVDFPVICVYLKVISSGIRKTFRGLPVGVRGHGV
jgi:hypothetical protein